MFQIKEVKELVDDAVEYHNNPHIQPLMTTDCTEMRGAQDAVMMITALEDANLVQYKVRLLIICRDPLRFICNIKMFSFKQIT